MGKRRAAGCELLSAAAGIVSDAGKKLRDVLCGATTCGNYSPGAMLGFCAALLWQSAPEYSLLPRTSIEVTG